MVWKKCIFFPFNIWLVCSLFVWNFRCVIILHLAVKKWWTGSVSGSHHLPTAQVSVEYVFKGFLRPWTRRDVERVSWALGSNIYCIPEYWNIPGWHVGHGWTLWCLVNITSCSQRVGCNTIPPLENKGKTLPLLTRGNHWSFEGLILYKHDFHLPKTARVSTSPKVMAPEDIASTHKHELFPLTFQSSRWIDSWCNLWMPWSFFNQQLQVGDASVPSFC